MRRLRWTLVAACAAIVLHAPPTRAADAQAPACPATVPVDGTPCDAGLCEYGGDSHSLCTTIAYCKGSTWSVTLPDAGCGTSAADCPSSFASIDAGVRCPLAAPDEQCIYAEGICSCPRPCALDGGALDWQWECRAWSDIDPGCPVPRPLFHAACTLDGGQQCFWNGCCWRVELGYDEQCVDGEWAPYYANACACAAPEQCPFGPLVDAGLDADAGMPGNDEGPVLAASGCGCTFGPSSATPALFVLALGIVFVRRRRAISDRTRRRSC